jgi:hypothetical protein
MISFWWAFGTFAIGFGLGLFILAICAVGGQADDWMDGYWAARRDMEREGGGRTE